MTLELRAGIRNVTLCLLDGRTLDKLYIREINIEYDTPALVDRDPLGGLGYPQLVSNYMNAQRIVSLAFIANIYASDYRVQIDQMTHLLAANRLNQPIIIMEGLDRENMDYVLLGPDGITETSMAEREYRMVGPVVADYQSPVPFRLRTWEGEDMVPQPRPSPPTRKKAKPKVRTRFNMDEF